jgi:hypothetical protein
MLDFVAEYKSKIPEINLHYLNRYISFVTKLNKKKKSKGLESHHILLKSIFPEYKSFALYPTNKSVLTPREHFIAHKILYCACKQNQKISAAYVILSNSKKDLISSRDFEKARKINSENQMNIITVINLDTKKIRRTHRDDILPNEVSASTGKHYYWNNDTETLKRFYEWEDIPDGYNKSIGPNRKTRGSLGMVWVHSTEDPDTYKMCETENIPLGWVRGNPTNKSKDRIWVNDGKNEFMVYPSELSPSHNLGRLKNSLENFCGSWYYNPNTQKFKRFAENRQPEGWTTYNKSKFCYNPLTFERKRIYDETQIPDGWVLGHGSAYYHDPDTLVYRRYTIGKQPDHWKLGKAPKKEKKYDNYITNRPKTLCPHCNRLISINVAKKHHFDNCRAKI